MLTVVCVKQGTLYGPEYVNILAAMVRRHLTLPHVFVCFTDDPQGVECKTRPIRDGLEGWWGKLALFAEEFEGRVLFFDLDTVILGSLDDIASYNGPFAALRDFYFPKRLQSSVMAWTPSDMTRAIWISWDRSGRPRVNGGDQTWIAHAIPIIDRWQEMLPMRFVSYKADCFFGPPPRDAKVICFHGEPRPHQCLKRKWVAEAWRA